MRIYVKTEGRRIFLPIPSRLVFSKASAWVIRKSMERYVPKETVPVSPEDLAKLFSVMRTLRRKRGRMRIVEVDCTDGTRVWIDL